MMILIQIVLMCSAGKQIENEVKVPEISVVEDHQIIENEVRTQITVE